MAISKRLRFEILRRDNHTCRYCGRSAPEFPLTVDHVVPEALGGSDDPSNLVAACSDCNGGKSSVPVGAPLIADVAADAMRWAAAMRQAADEIAAEDDALERICVAVRDEWRPRYIPSDYRGSICSLVKAGLTQEDLIAMVHVAQSARGVDDRWAYFCGCCWKRVTQRQERAADILSRGSGDRAVDASLSTCWTAQDVDALVARAESTAARWLTQESIDSAFCSHKSWGEGDCGDPLCRVSRAEAVGWMADSNILRSMRDDAVMAAAEALLDA